MEYRLGRLPFPGWRRISFCEGNTRNRVLLMLLYASESRVSEVCGLCWRVVQANGDGAQITVFGKGGKTRTIAVRAQAAISAIISSRPH
jgi:site-specific recombinase XerD